MVRTRFAPSPTGYLHIGGVRTALFNWLFARKHGGQFILRIDDTDAERNVAEALEPILHGFRWLGLDWDEGPTDDGKSSRGPHAPYFQSQRQERYQAAVAKLLAAGFAYRDYATTEDVQAERTAAEKEKRPFVYSRRWMAETQSDAERFESQGRKGVVRLKIPREGTLVIPDIIRGDVQFQWASEQDHVVQRADGTCLYHLANVVDDYDFEITHVIRAEEHLSNTPRQIFIAQSLGYPLPKYAHLPYVAEPGSKNKLSKRKLDKYLKNPDFAKVNEHGQAIARAIGLGTSTETFNPVIVDFYEQVGYLPQAILNYLLLLGWSLDDTTEFFTREEMVDRFTLERVNRAPASFDPKKLLAFQEAYIRRLAIEEKLASMLPFLQKANLISETPTDHEREKLNAVIRACGERLKTFGDILSYADFFFVPDERVVQDQSLVLQRFLDSDTLSSLRRFKEGLRDIPEFSVDILRQKVPQVLHEVLDLGEIDTAGEYRDYVSIVDLIQREFYSSKSGLVTHEELEGSLKDFSKNHGIKVGDMVNSVRLALTGKTIGPGLYEVMAILGREACVARIDSVLDMVQRRNPSVRFANDEPNALDSEYEAVSVNQPIVLYGGPGTILVDETQFSGALLVRHDWQPTMNIRCHFECNEFLWGITKSAANVTPLGLDTSFEALISRISHQSGRASTVTLLPRGPTKLGDASALKFIRFHLANFPDYRGTVIRRGLTSWVGRLTLTNQKWKITIDLLPRMRERRAKLEEVGGYAVSHVGTIEDRTGASFAITPDSDIGGALQYFLTFCRGAWAAPLFLKGYDEAGKLRWQEWSVRLNDPWSSARSWYPRTDINAVEGLFQGFMERWNNSSSRDQLRTAIYWYVLANATEGVLEPRFIASCVLLEALGSLWTGDVRFRLSARHLEGLFDYVRALPDEDFAKEFTTMRRRVLHPARYPDSKLSGRRMWRLLERAVFLGEQLLLRWCNYEGRLHNRVTSKWSTSAEAVPWTNSNPS